MKYSDIVDVAGVHAEAFPRQLASEEWVSCSLGAFPKSLIFVAEADDHIQGYVMWTQRSGFRESVVIELEQIAVLPQDRGQGVATGLIAETLPLVEANLAQREATLKAIMIPTRTDNEALRLYERTLGARIITTIPDLYSADEAILIARSPSSEI